MNIIREPDGTLLVPAAEPRSDAEATDASDEAGAHHAGSGAGGGVVGHDEPERKADEVVAAQPHPLHPGEGGYDEALAEWDHQQDPGRAPAVSTPSGREKAMLVVHAVATAPKRLVAGAVDALSEPDACAGALRHVLAGGVHSVADFAAEVAAFTDSVPLPAHEVTQIIGDVLAAVDA